MSQNVSVTIFVLNVLNLNDIYQLLLESFMCQVIKGVFLVLLVV